jgi:hypothetical protein
MSVATKGGTTFLQRNKRKSALAALLLFLRERKMLALLLFLVLGASTVFLSPSSWITGLPGGERFAAGVAWIAGKVGVDVSRWGLGFGGKHSYGDLLAQFRAARESRNGAGGVGWGPFFGHGGGAVGGAAAGGQGSLDFVKGSKSDLDHGVGAGTGGAGGGQSVAGIVDPADPKARGGDAVTLSEADLGGEREGYVNGVKGKGFSGTGRDGAGGGPGGGSSPGGNGSLSGGAYASKGFFSGTGGAAATPNGLARTGLATQSSIATPASAKGGAAKGSLSSMASRAVDARATKGILGAQSLGGNKSFTQLAEGGARSAMVLPDCETNGGCCKPPSCPSEYAATNIGAVFDGNSLTPGLLTSNDPGGNSSGLINSTVNLPPADGNGDGGGGNGAANAAQMQECAALVTACQDQKTAKMPEIGADQQKLNPLYQAIPGACGDPCHCGNCNNLKSQIGTICADMKTQLAAADKPCAPLPDYCAALGFTPAQFDPSALGQSCQSDFGQCGPKGLLAQLACLLGS